MCIPNPNMSATAPQPPPPAITSIARASDNADRAPVPEQSAAAQSDSAETGLPANQDAPAAAPQQAQQPQQPQSEPADVTDFETTHYGYKDDPTPDADTKAGKGAFGKLVAGDSLALTDSAAQSLGAKPGDKIEMTDAKGNTRKGTYMDRAPEKNKRIDIYDPEGSEAAGTPFQAVSARRISIGTGLASAASVLYPDQS